MRNGMSNEEREFMDKTMERVFALLEKANKKDYPLELDIGLSVSSIKNWRARKSNAGTYSLVKVANYFNVSLDYLVGRETTATIAETQQNTAYDVTTAPLLNFWQQLDEMQQSKVLVYMQGMLGITDQSIPTPMDIAINEGRTIGHKRGREEVEKQKQKKTI